MQDNPRAILLSDADHAAVTASIEAAEAHTSGEIVTVATERSDPYADIPLLYGIVAMLLAAIAAALCPMSLERLVSVLTDAWVRPSLGVTLAVLAAALALVLLIVWGIVSRGRLRMTLAPGFVKRRRVRHAAVRAFRLGTEARTLGRTGVLIYLSVGERRAEIVADAAIHARVPPEAWGEAMALLIELVRAGQPGAGLVAAIEAVGALLVTEFPRDAADINEVPDRLIEL